MTGGSREDCLEHAQQFKRSVTSPECVGGAAVIPLKHFSASYNGFIFSLSYYLGGFIRPPIVELIQQHAPPAPHSDVQMHTLMAAKKVQFPIP